MEEPHAEPFARAVVLGDERAWKGFRGLDDVRAADRRDRARRAYAVARERRVLIDLAELELERAAVVDDAPAVRLQPREHARGDLRRVAMAARVRGRAHAVVEDAVRRRGREIEDAFAQEPFFVGQLELGERRTQRLHPGVVFVDDVDLRHAAGPVSGFDESRSSARRCEVIKNSMHRLARHKPALDRSERWPRRPRCQVVGGKMVHIHGIAVDAPPDTTVPGRRW